MVSACLVGAPCRYDGGSCLDPRLLKLLGEGKLLPVCPEQLGGLPTPRPAAELTGGDGAALLEGKAKVLTREGKDLSAAFRRGAEAALALARAAGVKRALLKEGSPSCGSRQVHDGAFSGIRVPGAGVTTALLRRHGIKVSPGKSL